jgi:hypothetical protein
MDTEHRRAYTYLQTLPNFVALQVSVEKVSRMLFLLIPKI